MVETILRYAAGTVAALFPIFNPIGAVPTFHSLAARLDPATRSRQMRLSVLYATAILLVAAFVGRELLNAFDVSLSALEVAGGLLVVNAGWPMVTGRPAAGMMERGGSSGDIALVPMALPLLAGPGSIGLVIGLSADRGGAGAHLGTAIGIIALGALTFALLAAGGPLVRLLGPKGLELMTRLFGLVILSIGVALVAEGVQEFAGLPGRTLPP